MSVFWKGQRVVVTGGSGFIGSHMVEQLVAQEAHVTVVDNISRGKLENLREVRGRIQIQSVDLRNVEAASQIFRGHDIVIHLAARVAGVSHNQAHPAEMFYKNSMINIQVLEAARLAGVTRFEAVSTACVYPRDCIIPTPESEGFRGDPEPSNLGYGWSKRMLEIQARLYAEEYKMEIGVVRPYNAYGPRDHFDTATSHVIPALIRRVLEGEDPVVVWGGGEQTRAFLYVDDFARGILEAAQRHRLPDPVNLGTREEISIRDLIHLIVEISGKNPEIVFDRSKPSGQPRRNCDTGKSEQLVGFRARVSLQEGLRRTIAWYQGVLNCGGVHA
ncbi:MAG: NAD-dependent epimerase/dehydratase family protein [Candidatus Omnitrophica bacterium]|nr:NAD-dependent epimerase/dehydratase family protein [Candidatus Omnitrophota bacterium]